MGRNVDVLFGRVESDRCQCAACARVMGSHEVLPLSAAEKAAKWESVPVGHCPFCQQFDDTSGGLVYLKKDIDEFRKARDKDEGEGGAAATDHL